MSSDADIAFWEKPLEELNTQQWEQLCDGCGRCCLKKLEDEDTGEIHYTRVVCQYFDTQDSQCSCYLERTTLVPECVDVKKVDIASLNWMPDTCAYRLRNENLPLYDWHPLIAGNRTAMHEAGINIADSSVSELFVHPDGLEEHIIRWVKS